MDLTTQVHPIHVGAQAVTAPGRHSPAWIWAGSFKSKKRVTNKTLHVIFILKPKCLKIFHIFERQQAKRVVSNMVSVV